MLITKSLGAFAMTPLFKRNARAANSLLTSSKGRSSRKRFVNPSSTKAPHVQSSNCNVLSPASYKS